MGAFSDVPGANPTGSGEFFVDGRYKVGIVSLSRFQSRDPRKGSKAPWIFKVETEVLKVLECRREDERGEPLVKPGQVRAWILNMDKVMSPGNVKAFFMQWFGHDDFSEEDMEDCCDPDSQPLAGKEWLLECHTITTKANTPFTVHKWTYPYVERRAA